MRKIPGENLITEGKSNKNKTSSKGKTMFGYNVLGFGAGGSAFAAFDADYLIVAGRGPGGCSPNGGGGAGGQKKWAVSLPPILRGILIHRRRITEQTLKLFQGLVLWYESKVSPNLDPLALQLMVLCVGLASL